jgi:hypothetical protein
MMPTRKRFCHHHAKQHSAKQHSAKKHSAKKQSAKKQSAKKQSARQRYPVTPPASVGSRGSPLAGSPFSIESRVSTRASRASPDYAGILIQWYECNQLLDYALPFPTDDEDLGSPFELPSIQDIISQPYTCWDGNTVPDLSLEDLQKI